MPWHAQRGGGGIKPNPFAKLSWKEVGSQHHAPTGNLYVNKLKIDNVYKK
jgi:hypothetical protein